MPKKIKLAQSINRYRGRGRERDIIDLEFILNLDAIPDDFLISDIIIEGNRHLIFGLSKIIDNFKDTTTFYIDGTFRIVNKPFYQLYTLHP